MRIITQLRLFSTELYKSFNFPFFRIFDFQIVPLRIIFWWQPLLEYFWDTKKNILCLFRFRGKCISLFVWQLSVSVTSRLGAGSIKVRFSCIAFTRIEWKKFSLAVWQKCRKKGNVILYYSLSQINTINIYFGLRLPSSTPNFEIYDVVIYCFIPCLFSYVVGRP